MRFPKDGYEPLDCPRCGLPNPKGLDPVIHQERNCPYCRAGGYPARAKERTWKPGDPVKQQK